MGHRCVLTWRHVKGTPAAKVICDVLFRGQAEIRQLHGPAAIGHQDILGLEVSMVDPHGMAMLDRVQDLEEGSFGQVVIPEVELLLRDTGKEVAFWAVLQDHKGAVGRIQDLDEGDDARMQTGFMMELDLPLLERAGPGIQANLGQGLDGIADIGIDVHGRVDDPISPDSDNAGKF